MRIFLNGNVHLKHAIDVFVRGEFYCSRQPGSQIYDYDGIKHLSFGTNVDGRTDELVVYHATPVSVMEVIKHLDLKNLWVTLFSETEPTDYILEGLSVYSIEYLMYRNLVDLPIEHDRHDIKRITNENEAQNINLFFNKQAIDLNKLRDPNIHYYVCEVEGEPASHGIYVRVDQTVFLSNVYTSKLHRGKGIATSLCRKMLWDAKQEGHVQSVLVSSQKGHSLYLKLGYCDVAKMWVLIKMPGGNQH